MFDDALFGFELVAHLAAQAVPQMEHGVCDVEVRPEPEVIEELVGRRLIDGGELVIHRAGDADWSQLRHALRHRSRLLQGVSAIGNLGNEVHRRDLGMDVAHSLRHAIYDVEIADD